MEPKIIPSEEIPVSCQHLSQHKYATEHQVFHLSPSIVFLKCHPNLLPQISWVFLKCRIFSYWSIKTTRKSSDLKLAWLDWTLKEEINPVIHEHCDNYKSREHWPGDLTFPSSFLSVNQGTGDKNSNLTTFFLLVPNYGHNNVLYS